MLVSSSNSESFVNWLLGKLQVISEGLTLEVKQFNCTSWVFEVTDNSVPLIPIIVAIEENKWT